MCIFLSATLLIHNRDECQANPQDRRVIHLGARDRYVIPESGFPHCHVLAGLCDESFQRIVCSYIARIIAGEPIPGQILPVTPLTPVCLRGKETLIRQQNCSEVLYGGEHNGLCCDGHIIESIPEMVPFLDPVDCEVALTPVRNRQGLFASLDNIHYPRNVRKSRRRSGN